jgi:hypothetical protein
VTLASNTTVTTNNSAGTLLLDFNVLGTATTSVLSSTSLLALDGVTLNVNGAAATRMQTFGGITLNAGAPAIGLNSTGINLLGLTLGGAVSRVENERSRRARGGHIDLASVRHRPRWRRA